MLDSRHPSLSQSGQDGMWWIIDHMGWEAGAGLVLLPLVHLDLFVVLQETLLPVHRPGEVALPSVGGTGDKCRPYSDLWCGEMNQIFPSLLPLLKSCVVSFDVLPIPGTSRSCLRPGESRVLALRFGCLSLGQVSLAAVLAPLPTSPFTSWKRSCTPSSAARTGLCPFASKSC